MQGPPKSDFHTQVPMLDVAFGRDVAAALSLHAPSAEPACEQCGQKFTVTRVGWAVFIFCATVWLKALLRRLPSGRVTSLPNHNSDGKSPLTPLLLAPPPPRHAAWQRRPASTVPAANTVTAKAKMKPARTPSKDIYCNSALTAAMSNLPSGAAAP